MIDGDKNRPEKEEFFQEKLFLHLSLLSKKRPFWKVEKEQFTKQLIKSKILQIWIQDWKQYQQIQFFVQINPTIDRTQSNET